VAPTDPPFPLPGWLQGEISDQLEMWNEDFTDLDWDIKTLSDGRIQITMTLEFEEDEDGSL